MISVFNPDNFSEINYLRFDSSFNINIGDKIKIGASILELEKIKSQKLLYYVLSLSYSDILSEIDSIMKYFNN